MFKFMLSRKQKRQREHLINIKRPHITNMTCGAVPDNMVDDSFSVITEA
jgi:hypothetical protein